MFYRGQTLVSLMISISLSSFLMLIILAFYQHVQQHNREILLRLQLQTETQRVLHLMSKDLRRSGFRAVSDNVKQDNFVLFETDDGKSIVISQATHSSEKSCVLFFYDLDESGCLGKKTKHTACIQNEKNATEEIERELFGYRLNQGMIETRLSYKNAVNAACQKSDCQSYLQESACNGGGWADLMDDSEYKVVALQFSWLIENKAVEIYLKVVLKQFPHIQYETAAIVPIFNSEAE
ncbi:MAG: hypothetical protein Q4B95_04405 [Lonepinella koalarum]|nr:hypothetical protein [Lonepinella koalarum]